MAPAAPVRSLRQNTQAEALRSARTCYDHLAGELGVAIFTALLHMSGAAGRALATRLFELRWIRRADSGRAVLVTKLGRRELPQALGVNPA